MDTIKSLIDQLMKETKIMQNALRAGDLEVALEALNERDQLISLLEQLNVPERANTIKEIYPEYEAIDKECKTLIADLKNETEAAFYKNRSLKHQTHKNRIAHDRYSNNALSEFGSKIDNRK